MGPVPGVGPGTAGVGPGTAGVGPGTAGAGPAYSGVPPLAWYASSQPLTTGAKFIGLYASSS